MAQRQLTSEKFADPAVTAAGERRACAPFRRFETLWFNTGTLCNIQCKNCYIESSPKNDRLVYLTRADVEPFLDELAAAGERDAVIGLTGGEPFLAPEILDILEAALSRGHAVLVLTNAMRPMMRPRIRQGLQRLNARYPGAMTLRVSLDHHTCERHDAERAPGAFDAAIEGLRWLAGAGLKTAIAGRTLWDESETDARQGYAALCARIGIDQGTDDPATLVLFPEMKADAPAPEISENCWSVLGKSPESLMCASSRMVVKRRGEDRAVVTACTLLPYDERFALGDTLRAARGAVALNHPYCASFCVLGGGSCSA